MRGKTSFSTQFFGTSYFDDIGKNAAEWLRDQFLLQDYHKLELLPVDWGWILITNHKPFISWVGCSHDMAHSDRWSIILGVEPKLRHKMFKKAALQNHFDDLKKTVNNILLTIPDIHDIEWQETQSITEEREY